MRRRRTTWLPSTPLRAGRWRQTFTRRLLAVAGASGAAVLGMSLTASAVTADAEGLQVTYPDGELDLQYLAPGQTIQGQAQVTNNHDAEITVELASDWPNPPLDLDSITLTAQLCTTPWENDACSGGAQDLALTAEPTPVGTLGAGESWYLLVSVTLAADAANDTQNLSAPFTLQLLAQGDEPDDQSPATPPPDEGELPGTGTSPWLLVGVAAAVLAGGALVMGLARARRNGAESRSAVREH